ncbi:MAG TPA: AarF/UbiB family protein [Ktedonobacterales bacterium]|nr:AarF/UbiB family protein [Ktedonobacterales bacterium]
MGGLSHRLAVWRRRNSLWRGYRVAALLFRTLFIINRERMRVVRARERGDYSVHPDIETLKQVLRDFRRTAIEMGGLLIKLGQFLGARADLLPPEALAELAALQDEVQPEPFDAVVEIIQREYQAPLHEIFASIDERPTGSASLGQVHRAILHDGRVVALKVQRPGIDRIVKVDLQALRLTLMVVRLLAPAADRIVDLRALYREFSRTIFEELDYQREGRNAEQFARIFADNPRILVPRIYWSYTTTRTLALEWIDAIKITDFAALDAAGLNRAELARQLADSYFKQTLDAGFFHADPHPGNISAQPIPHDPGQARLVFLDFGMMGVITPRARRGLQTCFSGMVGGDAALFLKGLDELGFVGEEADRALLERAISAILSRFMGIPVSQLGHIAPDEALQDVGGALYDQPFRLPAEFAFFGRAIGMLAGLTASLAPDFNFLEVATPYARKLIGELSSGADGLLGLLGVKSVEELAQVSLREGLAVARSIARLPHQIDRILTKIERGELRVIVEPQIREERQPRRRRGRNHGDHGFDPLNPLAPLSRSVPLWAPLGVAGLVGAVALVTRWLRHSKPSQLPKLPAPRRLSH